jgi:opacity protein-like surface antigen
MRSNVTGLIAVVALVFLPRAATAQGYFTPNVGYDFGGDAGNCPSLFNDCSSRKTSFGIAAGFLAGGILGFEEDFAYAPDFYGQSPTFDSNNVLTLMSNVVLGVPLGPIRPYVAGGIGLFRSHLAFTTASLATVDNTGFGYDFGGGVMLLLPAHLGFRGEYQYLRSAKELTVAGLKIDSMPMSFSRVSLGLVIH